MKARAVSVLEYTVSLTIDNLWFDDRYTWPNRTRAGSDLDYLELDSIWIRSGFDPVRTC